MKDYVVLINPPLYYSHGWPCVLDVSVPPLGLLFIASYVNKYSDRFKAVVIDVAREQLSLKEIKEKVESINPLVIGISAMTPQLQGVVELGRYLKNNLSINTNIFIGGPHVSADSGFVSRFSGIFDYGITGEAEKTFLESMNRIAKGEEIPRIQEGEVIDDLDSIPFPDRGLIKREKYSEYESMIFSRGCPYACYYCSRPSISKKVRYRSVDNLIDEIKHVYKYCFGKIDFQDDTFTMDNVRVLQLCERIGRENLKLAWRCNTRIDLVDEEIIFAMKKAGCELIHFGIEAGNERIRRDVVKKGSFSNKQIYDVFKMCKKHGIKTAGYFMIGHPQETKQDIEETKKVIFNSGLDLLGLSIPIPFPGSRLYDFAKQEGVINEKIIDQFAEKKIGEGYSGNYPVFISRELPKEYIFSVMRSINRRFYLSFKTFWNRLKEDIMSFRKLKRDAKDLISIIINGMSTRKPYKYK